MGKLRSLRRCIERDPKAWIHEPFLPGYNPRARWARKPYPWEKGVGPWVPNAYIAWGGIGPYQRFVRSVLRGLGYDVR